MNIHVHTQVDITTTSYARFMWQTMKKLADEPEKLRLTAHSIGVVENISSGDPSVELVASYFPNVKGANRVGSVGHATVCDNTIKHFTKDCINIIVDSDTVVLAKGWDTHTRQKTLVDHVGSFGTCYEDVGGYSSGTTLEQTYKGAPNVIWMTFSPEHDWSDLRLSAQKGRNLPINTQELSDIYRLPIGYNVLCDVGWEIPSYLYIKKIKFEGLKQVKPQGPHAIVLKGLSDYHEEYHVNGVPFVAHQRGSMSHPFRSGQSRNFYEKVDAYLVNLK